MHKNQQLVTQFYQAFQQKNYQEMIACYHPNIHFRDEVFDLHGKSAGAMWHMLCERGKDLALNFSDVSANDAKGKAHWEANYTFSLSGRKVHNVIDASFQFQDGKIINHVDVFDFWKWTRMALGPTGLFLGWTPLLRKKVAATANKSLKDFIVAHPEYQ